MPNLHFAVLAAPDKHEQIMKDVNKWKYELEGEQTVGEVSPAIHEIKFYEVRIPSELEADFVRDMGLKGHHNRFGTTNSWLMKCAYAIYRLVLFFSPYRSMDESKLLEKKKYDFSGTWHYALPIGKLTRRKMKVKHGKDREVL